VNENQYVFRGLGRCGEKRLNWRNTWRPANFAKGSLQARWIQANAVPPKGNGYTTIADAREMGRDRANLECIDVSFNIRDHSTGMGRLTPVIKNPGDMTNMCCMFRRTE